ncbi:hypothetical protein CBR_g19659 [Chara braunii]|uniref:CCHC-type domain-containing protein n=1 Tax=Chara braunii TaxID=69332 RepID=A0A388KYK9_CHABU|nr:hypothetical protein CBR_g19659 [Chara braunii]|eukprot:GBG75146.1 hypothetical protein CBR_g19659 [Chara braunii]
MVQTDFVRGLSDSRLRKKIRKKCNPIEHTVTELIQYAIKYGKENYDVGLDSESDEDDPSGVRRNSYSTTAQMFEDRFGLGPTKKGSDRKASSSASTSCRSSQAQGGRGEEEVSMKEVATQLVTVVAPLTEFVQGLQRQRIAAAQRQQAAMAAGAPMIRPALAGAVPPLRCYNCNQPGHLAKDCPKPRTQSGPTGPTVPSQISLAAPTAAGQGRVATVMDTGTTKMVTPAATEIGPDEYMAAAMFEPGTIGVIRHVQRITEESDLGPWRPGFEDLTAPDPEYKDGHIDVLDALKALDLRIPVPIPYLLTISEAANEKLIERCLKNRRRFEESRKGKEPVLRDLPPNEESQPSTSKVHEANRIGMIQTVDSASERPEQGSDGREHVIEYESKTLSQAQSNYEACKGECLAVVWGVQHFRPYLYDQKFVLVTDHQPLLSLRNNMDYTGTLGRWAVRLQDYDFDIRHRATRQHGNADGLTRLQLPSKSLANEKLIPWKPISPSTESGYGEVNVLHKGSRMNHRQPEHEPLEHFQTPLADRLLRHQFNEERQLRCDIQQVNVPTPGVADLAAYSLLCDHAGVYVDVTQLPGRETTRVFIEFRALQVAPNFVHSVATFIGDLTILPPPSRELARSFVREYAVQAARSVARVQGRGGHRFTAHETLLRRAEDGPIALGPYPMREFSKYLVELTDVEPLPFADEDAWELHRALYQWVALGMFRFFVDHEDHCIGEHFVVYYVITRPKPAQKEGTVALYQFAQLQTIDPGLLELIHLELLSIAQVIASEEEEIQPRLRTAAALRRMYNGVVISDYIAQHAERLEDFPEEKPLRPPSSYPRPAPPKAPKKTPKRKRRLPSPGAQGSRIGGGEEVVQPVRMWNLDPVPGSAATRVKETVVTSPPFPRVPDLNLDGAGPSTAAAGGGSRMGLPDPVFRSPVLAGPFRFRPPPRKVDFMVEPTTIRLEAIAGALRPDPAWEPYLTPPFQGCTAVRLAGMLIYETGQRPNVVYHFLVFAAQKRERRPYTETHMVMTGPGPRSERKRVVQAVADLAPRVLSHVPGAFLYPSFVQHHFHEEDVSTTPATMAAFLPPIPPPLSLDIDHFL